MYKKNVFFFKKGGALDIIEKDTYNIDLTKFIVINELWENIIAI